MYNRLVVKGLGTRLLTDRQIDKHINRWKRSERIKVGYDEVLEKKEEDFNLRQVLK